VEQVMYIDKKLQEHSLLQAIARVNRVANRKNRGFIVDYIGLANHLTYALSIYSEEDAKDIDEGLKSILSTLACKFDDVLLMPHDRGRRRAAWLGAS
jgi:type I restriction enzyme R subunit